MMSLFSPGVKMWRAVFYKMSASRKMSSKGLRKCHLQYLTLAQANKDRWNFLISVNLLWIFKKWERCVRVCFTVQTVVVFAKLVCFANCCALEHSWKLLIGFLFKKWFLVGFGIIWGWGGWLFLKGDSEVFVKFGLSKSESSVSEYKMLFFLQPLSFVQDLASFWSILRDFCLFFW